MKNTILSISIIILGFAGVFGLTSWLEHSRPKLDTSIEDNDLYFSAQRVEFLSADFKGLVADWYWMQALQYLGKKIVSQGDLTTLNINNLRPLNPRLLYPMLDTAATLDPQFMTIYSYGASILPAIDNESAIKLLEKGVSANPEKWQLYHNLGFIYWQTKNYPKAAETYEIGATKPNAPLWLKQMSARMNADGASRNTAREIYRQMFETATDEQTRQFAELRFAQVESLDERDAIKPVLENFKAKNGRCANDWRELLPALRQIKLPTGKSLNFDQNASPLDPTNVAYLINNETCEPSLDYGKSKIPAQ